MIEHNKTKKHDLKKDKKIKTPLTVEEKKMRKKILLNVLIVCLIIMATLAIPLLIMESTGLMLRK